MKAAIYLFSLLSSFSLLAVDCDNFRKDLLAGDYSVQNYECLGLNSSNVECEINTDAFTKVSNVVIETIPTGVELALNAKLIDTTTPINSRVVEQVYFSKYSSVGQSNLVCFDFYENDERVLKIKNELEMGYFKAYSEISKVNDIVVLEIRSTFDDITTVRKFTLKE